MIKLDSPGTVFRATVGLLALVFILLIAMPACTAQSNDILLEAFEDPPDSSKPGVYWYFMDGNLSMEEMTKDLESMKESGINHVIFLEVGI